ncbi:unannotated protein [freshwater metagenome]|uniref:Unannotated protein n=1 Tax=freshwater metagenome TaxID=449393 RepID=A0A6J7CIA6_9ZZZZ|nr:YvcK family protein [Actinomycetota bacterium]MUH57576.1 uridine diphosphate-N-acetylglucosamine-binding protein YvcK [Actinomycetota bacterium]
MKVVAIGGGHGTAVTLRALRSLNCDITAIVSVADDGGSTGVLRDALNIAGVGDIRKCLVALAAAEKPWERFFEFRFGDDTAQHHALGNLFLAAAIDSQPSLENAVVEVGRLLDICGQVLPASKEGVSLEAETEAGFVRGQAAITKSTGVRKIRTVPVGVSATDAGLDAIQLADFVVLGPGSLFTSVLAACVVPGLSEAIAQSPAKCVWIANLQGLDPESRGLGLIEQYAALVLHGIRVDSVIVHNANEGGSEIPGVGLISADVAGINAKVHDPVKLAHVLRQLMAN